MESFNKKVLGEVRGKVGNKVYKSRKGKSYIASVPSEYTMSMEPREVEKRSRFSVNTRFAKAIKSSDILYSIWDKKKAPASSAWNKICKVNFKLCGIERPTDKNVITPAGGFKLPVLNIAEVQDGIEADIGEIKLSTEEKDVLFIMIVSFYEPVAKEEKYFNLLVLKEGKRNNNKLTFTFDLSQKLIAEKYKHKTVYMAAIILDESGNVVRWSGSFAVEVLNGE